jgi:hypothetical protein
MGKLEKRDSAWVSERKKEISSLLYKTSIEKKKKKKEKNADSISRVAP